MMTLIDVIRALRKTTKRTEKEEILFLAYTECRDFFDWMIYVYDYEWIFWVKKLPDISTFAIKTNYTEIDNLLSDLKNRKYTGNAAQDQIRKVISESCDFEDWTEFFYFVLLKDLKAGLSEVTINKVLKKVEEHYGFPIGSLPYHIKNFECQLAKDGLDHNEKLSGVKIIQPKLDGVRALVIVDIEDNTVNIFSRNGKALDNFPQIEESFKTLITQQKITKSLVFDGEIISKNFSALMTQVNRKYDVDTTDATYCVFDVIPYLDFYNKNSSISQRDRIKTLDDIFRSGVKYIMIPQSFELNLDDSSQKKQMQTFMDTCVQQGLEGIMVKDPTAGYVCKRTDAWLKLKPKHTYDLVIEEITEGKGKLKNSMGTLLCTGKDNDDNVIQTNVGSGFSEELRQEIWNNKDKYIGKMIEVECDTKSKAKDSETYSLRFPTFLRFRFDRTLN